MKIPTSLFGRRFCQRICYLFTAFFVMAALFISTSTAHAYFTNWTGRDFGGQDLLLEEGDTLSGTFTNIGRLVIDAGITVSAGSSMVSLNTYETLINGTFFGGADLSPSLDIVAETSITLGGILDQWYTVSLAGETVACMTGSDIVLLPSGGEGNPGEQPVVDGGPITLAPVPVPSTLFLFASGLGIAAALCRFRVNLPEGSNLFFRR